jgi:glyoxylase-like metal-dependent hydrolase (beta-lactamase superfamily II)
MTTENRTLWVKKLDEHIWNFKDSADGIAGCDGYLVTGTKWAAVIDTLAGDVPLYDKVKELTALPIEVLITHGHGDHAGMATHAFHDAGCDLYMNARDHYMLNHGLKSEWFKPLEDGMVFDLGGFRLETISLFGHTPGQVVFLEREKQLLFTADAIGMGVFWMQLPRCLPLREFRKNLGRLWDIVKDMKDLKIHPGHRHQAPVQLGLEFMADTIYVTDKIISGEMLGEEREMDWGGKSFKYRNVKYKLITDYCYRPDNI